uniref:Amidase domain-containing protein n=1 Tax=Trichobilharzia regenti TaxID=157069 RepID=A0AA85K1X8_TRIRE|nr:unnamed protein product [Trichobilharzia regenti]
MNSIGRYNSQLSKELTALLTKHPIRNVILAISLGLISWKLLVKLLAYHNQKRLTVKRRQVEQNVDKVRRSLSNLPASVSLTICNESLSYLSEQIKLGSLEPADVLHAFQLKALELYDNGNSGISEFILEAEENAVNMKSSSDIDKESELYGIPISIKESFTLGGYDSTLGVIKLCNKPMSDDCVLVKVLKSVGSIPFVTTVTSQLCRTLDGFHCVYREAKHPMNSLRMTGGSSTGEAVLLALNGSPVGIGGDIAGSIRIPCAFCGLAGLKPTFGRLSISGIPSATKQSVLHIGACPGPMGRKVEDLARVMRALLCPTMFDMDPYVIPMRFNEDLYEGKGKRQLVIGYYCNLDDPNLIQVVDVNRQVVEKAVGALESSGHKVVKFTVPHPYEAYVLGLRALFADGGCELRKQLHGEPLSPQLKFLNLILGFPDFLKPIMGFLSRLFVGRPVGITSALRKLKDGQAALDLINGINSYRREFAKAWSEAGPLDALICPVSSYPAPPDDTSALYISPSIVYTFLYNILDYPAGAVPAGFVSKEDVRDALVKSESLLSAGDTYMSKVHKLLDGGENMPLSIQVVGKPYHEETVLRVMREIEGIFSP